HFFRPGNLIALRELALRQVTQVVDRSLESYLEREHIEQPGVRERIAVCISSNPAAQYLIARGWRMAQAISADFVVLYVDIGVDDNPQDQRTLRHNIEFAENLGAEVVKLKGTKVAETVAKYVRDKHVTQVVFGHSSTTGWKRYLYMSAIHKFLREAPSVDVHIHGRRLPQELMDRGHIQVALPAGGRRVSKDNLRDMLVAHVLGHRLGDFGSLKLYHLGPEVFGKFDIVP